MSCFFSPKRKGCETSPTQVWVDKGTQFLSSLASVLFFVSAAVLTACGNSSHEQHSHSHQEPAQEIEKGPHGGRMLRDGDFALELQIFEEGTPPRFRTYGYIDGKPIDPKQLTVEVNLERLGGKIEGFAFNPQNDFLTSSQDVAEPHSFDVKVAAQHSGKKHAWSYESYEGRVVIPAALAAASGITTEKASGRNLRTLRYCRGKIVPSEHRIAHIIPRFAGVVREGRKHIGDKVEKGEVLAIIESNQSLQPFEVRSQISGTVVNGHLIVGEYVPENQWVYVVADLSEVWADFFVPIRERADIAAGQKIIISSVTGTEMREGRIGYVAPYADERSQAQLIRAVVPNQQGEFLPGMFISGEIVVNESLSPVSVRKAAIQRLGDWSVVFVKVGDVYQATPVKIGRTDGDWVEILSGLSEESEYVVGNSFLIKADILKSGASHEH